jgi:hypothetical protein
MKNMKVKEVLSGSEYQWWGRVNRQGEKRANMVDVF